MSAQPVPFSPPVACVLAASQAWTAVTFRQCDSSTQMLNYLSRPCLSVAHLYARSQVALLIYLGSLQVRTKLVYLTARAACPAEDETAVPIREPGRRPSVGRSGQCPAGDGLRDRSGRAGRPTVP